MTLWYDAANLDADSAIDTIADGTNVLLWNDGSGNNRNAGQSATEWSGWYEADGLDGKAVVIFDTNDTLSMAPDVNGIKTVFAVFKQTSDESNSTKLFGGDFVTTSRRRKSRSSAEQRFLHDRIDRIQSYLQRGQLGDGGRFPQSLRQWPE